MIFENIPKELQTLKQWVCYSKDKLPKNAVTGKNAQSNNPDTWCDFETAKAGMMKYKFDGLGFMFANGYFGVDLDKCIENIDFVDEFVDSLKSYNEISMSGTGIHIICKGTLPTGQRRKGNVEMYSQGRYFAMTGNIYNEEYCDIVECTEQIAPLHQKYLGEQTQKFEYTQSSFEKVTLTDDEVFDKARQSKNGALFQLLYNGNWEGIYKSQSEADLAFCNLLAFWTQRDFTQMDRIFRSSGLMREKWNRKMGGTTYGATLINKAINECLNVYTSQKVVKTSTSTGAVVEAKKEYEQNDTGNAERMYDLFGKSLRYSYENKVWYFWNGKLWAEDKTGKIKRLADETLENMKKEAYKEEDADKQIAMLKWINKSSSSGSKDNMIKETQHIGCIPILISEMDTQPDLINCQNGIINLRNGELLPHDANYLCTKIANCEYDVTGKEPTLWLNFLKDITQGDKELEEYLQKAVGYSLTGSIREQCLFFLYGGGRNGKSTFLDIISELAGTYSSHAQSETIMTKPQLGNNTLSDIARLKGARFVTTVEPNDNVKLNEGLVKQLTGGDKVTARFLYGKEFEFTPEFKIWLGANHKPIIRGTDDGIWRRIRLIPFTAQIPDEKVDKNLKQKLKKELPQIMKWAVDGALKWQKEGLKVPAIVEKATQEYRFEMDTLCRFFSEYVVVDSSARMKASVLYNYYCEWADENNEFVMSSTKFGKEILAKIPDKKAFSDGVYYMGIKINYQRVHQNEQDKIKTTYGQKQFA